MVLSSDDAQAVVLNAVGTAVWHLVNGRRTVEEIVAVIVDRFDDASAGNVRSDVARLLERLAEAGLIEA